MVETIVTDSVTLQRLIGEATERAAVRLISQLDGKSPWVGVSEYSRRWRIVPDTVYRKIANGEISVSGGQLKNKSKPYRLNVLVPPLMNRSSRAAKSRGRKYAGL